MSGVFWGGEDSMKVGRKMQFMLLVLGATILSGCGADNYTGNSEIASDVHESTVASAPAEEFDSASANGPTFADAESETTKPASPPAQRKIIYNAELQLVVKELDQVGKRIQEIVAAHSGFISHSNIDTSRGAYRTGNWTARIPTDRYTEFLNEVTSLGTMISQKQDAKDVTEEFVDLQARIMTKQQLEKRLIELLEETKDGIKDVIEVERELARVREEIERLQGRLRFLSEQSALATVEIKASEQRDYQPPQAMTFGERIAQAWSDSLGALLSFLKSTTVVLVVIAPWLALFAFCVTIFYLVLRFLLRLIFRRHRLPAN
jgi:hypothetical protein